jgi:hypothetical protein
MNVGDPAQVLDVLRDVLLEHMDLPDSLPDYRVQSAVYIGEKSGRLISDKNIIEGNDAPGGLRLTMRSGCEYDLTLKFSRVDHDDA